MLVAPILFMKAWQLIEDPKHWTRGTYARADDGREVHYSSGKATSWCTIGACRKLYPFEERHALYDKLRLHIPDGSIINWNDTSDHDTVLAKLKELDI
mgnify:CR=1 FL=1